MELQTYKEENCRLADRMKIEEAKKLNEVKEKMLLEQQEMQSRHEKTLREMTQKYEEQVDGLTKKNENTSCESVSLQETKINLEANNREKTSKIATLTYELERALVELKELRDANKGLDTTKFAQEKSITEYMLKFENLQRELEDKKEYIDK